MQKLVWQNANGDEINLTGGNYGITEWEGFSNASLNIQNQQVPFQDGAAFLDALIEPRELSVTLKMQDKGNLEERYRMRRGLIHILNPKLGEGYLIYTNDFISKRIKCVAQIPLFETHNSDTRGTPKASLAWTACEPYWEDLEETNIEFMNGELKEVINEGDIPCQTKLKFYSKTSKKISNPSINNLTTNQLIKIEDDSVRNNIDVNTNIGTKSVEQILYSEKFVAGQIDFYGFTYIEHLDLYVLCYDGLLFKTKDFKNFVSINFTNKFNFVLIYNAEQKKCLILCSAPASSGNLLMKTTEDFNTFQDLTVPAAVSQNNKGRDGIYDKVSHKYLISTDLGLYTSENLSDWQQVGNFTLYNLCKFNNIILGTSLSAHIRYSSDLTNWNDVTVGVSEIFSIYVDREKVYLLNNNNEVYSSTNISEWNPENINITSTSAGKCITKINEKFYLLFNDYQSHMELYCGESLNNLRQIELPSDMVSDTSIYKIVPIYKLGIILFYNYGFYYTNNFIKYNNIDVPSRILFYQKKHNRFVGVAGYGKIVISYDLIDWIEFVTDGLTIRSFIYSEHFDCNYFSRTGEIGEEGYVICSNKNYNEVIPVKNVEYDGELKEVNNNILYMSKSGLIVYSNNSIDWHNFQINTQADIVDVSFDGEKYIILCDDGKIYTSENLTSYVLVFTLDNFTELYKIYYSNKVHKYFILGFNKIFVSTNLINWEEFTTPAAHNDIIIDSDIFNGVIFVSQTSGGYISDYFNHYICKYNNNLNTINIFFNILQFYIKSLIEREEGLVICSGNGILTIDEIHRNIINKLSNNSNMNFQLAVGLNNIVLDSDNLKSTDILEAKLTYRQKYIGV